VPDQGDEGSENRGRKGGHLLVHAGRVVRELAATEWPIREKGQAAARTALHLILFRFFSFVISLADRGASALSDQSRQGRQWFCAFAIV